MITLNAYSQHVKIPVPGGVEKQNTYEGKPFTALNYKGSDDYYEQAIDFALGGKITNTEKFNDFVFSQIMLGDTLEAVWFLHEFDPDKTTLFFYRTEDFPTPITPIE